MRAECLRGTTCVHLGGLAMNCALPGMLLGGVKVRHLHVFFSNSGLYRFSNLCGRCGMSPRDLNGVICPLRHSCSFNLGIAFWFEWAVYSGVGRVLLATYYFANTKLVADYGSKFVSHFPRADVARGIFFSSPTSLRACAGNVCNCVNTDCSSAPSSGVLCPRSASVCGVVHNRCQTSGVNG